MNPKFWKFTNNVDNTESTLEIEGVIAQDSWWGDEVTPEQFKSELKRVTSKNLTVVINSPGGEVFAGLSIYNAIRESGLNVTVRVDGVAASAASVIAMSGNTIHMSPGAMMMIHRPSVMAWGNVDDMDRAKEILTTIEDSIVPIYTARTGQTVEAITEMLNAETWFSADEAVAKGFADKVLEPVKRTEGADPVTNSLTQTLNTTQALAFSMDATKKSLHSFAEKVKAQDEANNEEKSPVNPDEETKEVEETKLPEPETPKPTEDPVSDPEEEKQEEDKVEEVVEDPKPTEKVETKPTNKGKSKMNPKDSIAKDSIVPKAEDVIDPAKSSTGEKAKMTKREARIKIVDALAAKFSNDEARFAELNEELKATMVIDGTSGEELFGQEVLARDIRQEYTNVGRVGALVNKIDIEGAEIFKQLVETAGNGFQPVALGGTKSQDQPVWSPVTFEPFEWALIVAWLDGVQKRSPIAVYNQIVRYIAREYAKLEDKVILTYAGGTYAGEVRPATGLVPILRTAGRVVPVSGYTSAAVLQAFGQAFGEVESDRTISVVVNRKTWGALAVTLDGFDRPLFTAVGEQIAIGALGTFNLTLSSVLADGDMVIGDYDDYNLVTRGALDYLFSREATIGTGGSALNLFTQDASALRADIDITGKPVKNESFVLLDINTGS